MSAPLSRGMYAAARLALVLFAQQAGVGGLFLRGVDMIAASMILQFGNVPLFLVASAFTCCFSHRFFSPPSIKPFIQNQVLDPKRIASTRVCVISTEAV